MVGLARLVPCQFQPDCICQFSGVVDTCMQMWKWACSANPGRMCGNLAFFFWIFSRNRQPTHKQVRIVRGPTPHGAAILLFAVIEPQTAETMVA